MQCLNASLKTLIEYLKVEKKEMKGFSCKRKSEVANFVNRL